MWAEIENKFREQEVQRYHIYSVHNTQESKYSNRISAVFVTQNHNGIFYFLAFSAKRSIRSQNHSAAIYLRFTRTITGFHWPHSSHKSGSLEMMYFLGGSFVPMILFQQSRQNSAIIITPLYDSITALQLQCILSECADVNYMQYKCIAR